MTAIRSKGFSTKHKELKDKIDSLTDFATDNLSDRTLEEDDYRQTAAKVVDMIEKTEEILKKFGKLINTETDMWYTGIGWTIRLNTRRKVFIQICLSDLRFEIIAITGDLFSENRNRFVFDYRNNFVLREYTYHIGLDDLQDVLRRFSLLFK